MRKNRWRRRSGAGAVLALLSVAVGCAQHGGGGTQGDSGSLNTEVTIVVTVAQCPVINAIVVAPARVDVGSSAVLTARAGLVPTVDEAGGGDDAADAGEIFADEGGVVGSYAGGDADVDRIDFSWSAPSGRFGAATEPQTTFTCTAPGTVMVTLTAAHQGCQVALAVPVDCVG